MGSNHHGNKVTDTVDATAEVKDIGDSIGDLTDSVAGFGSSTAKCFFGTGSAGICSVMRNDLSFFYEFSGFFIYLLIYSFGIRVGRYAIL